MQDQPTKKRATKVLSVRRTEWLTRDLDVIRQAFSTDMEATQWALKIAANILRYAWLLVAVQPCTIPEMRVSYPHPAGWPQNPYDSRMTQVRGPAA